MEFCLPGKKSKSYVWTHKNMTTAYNTVLLNNHTGGDTSDLMQVSVASVSTITLLLQTSFRVNGHHQSLLGALYLILK